MLKLVGDLEYEAGNYEVAMEWFNKWMDFTCKEDGSTYLKIANSYLETNQLEKVIEPADKAIAMIDPPKEGAYSLKVRSYYDRKMFDEAIDVMETALQVFPESDTWYTRLGLFYQITEQYQKALAMFELAYIKGFLTSATQHKQYAWYSS
jgi:tetratricopeptide (TPR) repeat protein